MPLETVDIDRIEYLATGTHRGALSPPEGDTYTEADLDEMAAAANELGDELRQPIRLGHRLDRRLKDDGDLEDDAQPAVGWLTNWRREGDKLVCSARAMPAKVADLIRTGAYRARSAEVIFNYRSRQGHSYRMVPAGMALLGATLPAVTGLADVFALYADTAADRRSYVSTGGEEGSKALQAELDAVGSALARLTQPPSREPSNTRPGGQMPEDKPPTPPGDDVAKLRADLDALSAELAGAKADREAATAVLGAFREQLGLAADAGADKIVEALKDVKAKAAEQGTTGGDQGDRPTIPPEVEAELTKLREQQAALEAKAQQGEEAKEELRVMRRRQVVGDAVRVGKIEPGEQGSWERRYDQAPEMTVEILTDMKPRAELVKTYGADHQPEPDEAARAEEDKLYKAYTDQVGG